MKKNKYIKLRHKIIIEIVRIPCLIFSKLFYHFKRPKKIKLKKDENVIVLSNHQTDFDPIFIHLSFNKQIYFVTAESVFSSKVGAFVAGKLVGCIPKKKGTADPKTIKTILTILKEKGCVGLFPEGNRAYGEFQFYFDESIAKLVKISKVPLVLYNFHGGNGCYPRFADKKRKGRYEGEIKRIIYPEEYEKMSNEELFEVIKENLRVYDSESGNLYKSKTRAQYLEELFFVCPKCNAHSTLFSKNEFISCTKCGLKVEYTEDLHLKSMDEDFKFDKIVQWYEYQKQWVRDYQTDDVHPIFEDKDVKIYETVVYKSRKLVSKGNMILNKDKMTIGKLQIPVNEIVSASIVGGHKIAFSTFDKDYLIVGKRRFNPVKYLLMFNKIETHMKEKQNDKYFTLV